jgi:hypothetical protein
MGQVRSLYEIVYVFIFRLSFALSCCVLIIVTFVLLNQIRSVRRCRKGEKLRYNIGIEEFLRWYSDRGQKSIFLRMLNSAQNRISAAGQILKIITSKPLIGLGHANNCCKDKKVFYNSCSL